MIALLQTLFILAALTLWLSRAERLVREYIAERKAVPAPAPASKAEPIPEDLLAQAMSYSDDWARQQATDHLYELYGKHKDWSTVRGALVAETQQGTI